MNSISVNLGKDKSVSYNIQLGHDVLERIGWAIKKEHPARFYVVIADSQAKALFGDLFVSLLSRLELPTAMVDFPAGEKQKTMATAITIIEKLVALRADRNTLIIALGGGVTGDLAGFVASVYLRSLPLIHIPTTLVAQVDSSIGGKNGVDLPAGKNLVGSIYQPRAVFIDTKFLASLPEREWKCGLAEVVKYGFIEGGQYLSLLEENISALMTRQTAAITPIIEGACLSKKGFVEIDEYDRGARRFLNLGHTLGHALETQSGYALSHGEAVALGIRAAILLSQRLYRLPREDVTRALDLMDGLGLPGKISPEVDPAVILEYLRQDKKREGNKINFILLKRLGMPFVTGGISETVLINTIEELKR